MHFRKQTNNEKGDFFRRISNIDRVSLALVDSTFVVLNNRQKTNTFQGLARE